MRRTRIIATIGPASESEHVLGRLVDSGIDVARLNASHAGRDELAAVLTALRAVSDDRGRRVAVMLDLGGPKLRVGEVADGTALVAGSAFQLVTDDCVGDSARACVTYPGLADDLSSGDRVLLDDGRIELRVRSTAPGIVETVVETGGPLSGHKGLNVPGVKLSLDPVTPKDEVDLAWALDAGVDLVAQSFVRSAEDVLRLRRLMGDRPVPIVAKIEKHEALSELGAIVDAADAVMVARGDLGVETSPEAVPVAQRRITRACRAAGKPVVIATQMLESMIEAVRPTRAEASDVAGAIFDGADAVMLSGETAVGDHPVEAVATMARIAEAAEAELAGSAGGAHAGWDDAHRDLTICPPVSGPVEDGQPLGFPGRGVTSAVSSAACSLASDLGAAAIITATRSGATARAVARCRPSAPIIAATTDEAVARRLMIVWGVTALVIGYEETVESMLASAVAAARAAGLVADGDLVVFTAGVLIGVPGSTNLVQVHRV